MSLRQDLLDTRVAGGVATSREEDLRNDQHLLDRRAEHARVLVRPGG